jgi:hypothetical protein
MASRKGEKLGWVLGWFGSFLWVIILAGMFFIQGKIVAGLSGTLLVMIVLTVIFRITPWRYPHIRYWRLLLVPFFLFLLSFVWAFWSFNVFREGNFNWWLIVALLPMLNVFFILGKKKWSDYEKGK